MTDALKTELVGVTFLIKNLQKIDEILTEKNVDLPPFNQLNRQDFIRKAVQEKLERVVKEK